MADLLNGAALPVPDWDSSFAFVLWVNKASQVPLAWAPQKTFRQPYGRVSCYSAVPYRRAGNGTELWEWEPSVTTLQWCKHRGRRHKGPAHACKIRRKKTNAIQTKTAALGRTEIAQWVKVECCQWKWFTNSLQSPKYIFLLCVFTLLIVVGPMLVLFLFLLLVIISYCDLVLMWFVFSCCEGLLCYRLCTK